jgi:hypothetical protein
MGMKKDEQQTLLCPVQCAMELRNILSFEWLVVYFADFQLLPWHISQWDPEFCVSSYDEFGQQQQQQQQQSISPSPPLLTG